MAEGISSSEGILFSVVIPCFNRADILRATLDSILAQTEVDYECIVVDDGSSQGAEIKQIVDSLADSRFRYIFQENQGGGAARNTGIAAARGKYIAFLDSDDVFLPHKLAKVKEHLAHSGQLAVVYSSAYVQRGVDSHDAVWIKPERAIRIDEDMGEYLFVANQVIQTSTIVIPADAARAVLFDPRLAKGQDLDFCVRCYASGWRFEMIDEPLVVWRDSTEAGRTSRAAGVSDLIAWSEKDTIFLTRKAKIGYMATVIPVFRPKRQILVVIRDLLFGVFIAGVPLKVVLRQFLRFALPRSAYRKIIDLFVRLRGRTMER